MSIWCWNCQGAGSTETVQKIREVRRLHFPDFMFLMETKQKYAYVSGLQKSLGYDKLFTVEPNGLSGGLAVMWKDSYNVEILSSDKRIIDMKISSGPLDFFLSCIYGDPVRARRQVVWDRLVDIGLVRDTAWVLAGDFNEIMSNEEKLGGEERSESTFWGFRSMAQNCKLKEIRSSGNIFSWAGKRESGWIQCRLDRGFGNDEWFNMFPRSHLQYSDMWASDHRPFLIRFAHESEDHYKRRFYFDKRMADEEGFEDLIKQSWCGAEEDDSCTVARIARCRQDIAKWKRHTSFNSKDKITRLKLDLEFEVSKLHANFHSMKLLRQQLATAYLDEERYWRQKCREEWLKAGDRNTRYFHNCVKGKKIQNRILMLLDELGGEHFSEGAKGYIAVEYFRDLFMSTNPFDLESLFEGFQSRVTQEMNTTLTAMVTADEIKQAAFSVKGSSAPGEDGLTGVFYQRFWHIVGPALVKEIQLFFSTSTIPDGWNHTQLSLIPKVTKPSRMQDLRPISLCSVQYKIISKILCNRLKIYLPELISETQGAFVSGRLISDNILIAHEMVHGLRTNSRVDKSFMAIKTDMSKAYDRVEWSFLEILLEKMGFDRIWIHWIMGCVSSVSYSVLLNGNSHGFIKPERGIRQGDPLSPFLFILCAEALVNCLNHSEANGRINGIRLAATGPSVHHLLFADDSLLMCRASVEDALEISRCLKLYGDASGQMINQQKSSIIFGSNVPEEIKMEVKVALGIDTEGGEGSYLGLPECFSGSKRKLLSFLREKLHGRLNGWFSKALSQGGKEILLKSICLALPIYAMICFKLPKDTCERMTSAMIQFWWSSGNNKSKIAWVAWQKLCKSKEVGGLGFHDLEKFNQALLGKQAWRLWSSPNSLLAQILKHRYHKNCNFLDSSVGTRPSYAWRSILHGRELLAKGLLRSIGSGENTLVWQENWLLDDLPRVPNYRQEAPVDLTLKVSDLIDVHSGQWIVPRVRETFSPDDVRLVLNTKINPSRHDNTIWCFTKSGQYSSKSGYKLLVDLQEMNSPFPALPPIEKQLWSDLWRTKTSPKLRHFLWRALSGALAVKERLRTRGIHLDTTCVSCGSASESICHVLFQCRFAQEVWSLSGIPPPTAGYSQTSMFLNLFHLLKCSRNPSLPLGVRLAFPWVLWHIWKARNGFIFEHVRMEPSLVLSRAMEEAGMWLTVNSCVESTATPAVAPTIETPKRTWSKPPRGLLKCNVGTSWQPSNLGSGASWIVRDEIGNPVIHSRRAFSGVLSELEASLRSLAWSIMALSDLHLDKVIIEFSCVMMAEALLNPTKFPEVQYLIQETLQSLHRFSTYTLNHVEPEKNRVAKLIAVSVTKDQRYQSYVAQGGPAWLAHTIQREALPHDL